MQVTRDVILDLLPLYLSGEASADVQALVREHLDRDPDLARLAAQWQKRLPEPPPAPARTDSQALAYLEARRRLALKTAVTAALIAAGLIALLALIGFAFFMSTP